MTPATARQTRLASCPPPKTLLRLDRKICGPTKFRPPLVRVRACCESRSGKVKCKPFPPCPKRSPS